MKDTLPFFATIEPIRNEAFMNPLFTVHSEHKPRDCLAALENGQVLFFPEQAYQNFDTQVFKATGLDSTHKNLSYDFNKKHLNGHKRRQNKALNTLQQHMHNYALFAFGLIQQHLPQYADKLEFGRTSYRPAEIEGRVYSKRKDDTRLHVDSFPSSPVYSKRILRVFCNINPHGKPRVWHVGEPFEKVIAHFNPRIPNYSKFKAYGLRLVKATKTLRSAYDHYMIHLHDSMKLDQTYQNTVHKQRIDFPAQSTWIVFTDQVSHAALSGQHLLEQTFYLPVEAMAYPDTSPLKQWQALRNAV